MIARDIQTESSVAFMVKEQSHVYEKGACTIYGRYDHEEYACYEVIRYPPGWATHGGGRGSRGGSVSKVGRGGGKFGRGASSEIVSAAVHTRWCLGPLQVQA